MHIDRWGVREKDGKMCTHRELQYKLPPCCWFSALSVLWFLYLFHALFINWIIFSILFSLFYWIIYLFLNPHPRICLLIFKERGRGGGKEGERGRKRERGRERKTSIGCLSYAPQLKTGPATYVCALTRVRTYNILVYRTML